jgi:hypothetical protein
LNTEEANKMIKKLSDATRKFIHSRTLLESNLFPVRSYMALGLYNLYEREYKLIKEITKKKSPEKIGKESKILNSEINQKTQFSIIVGYLVGREQVIIDGNLEDYGDGVYDAEKTKFLFDHWKRFSKIYRNDGNLLVGDSNGVISILDRKNVNELNDELTSFDSSTKYKIMKMAAFLQSYLYLANYESRGGVFNHGPYKIDDEMLLVREFIHLGKNTYGNIIRSKPSYPNIAIAMRLKDVDLQINEVGTVFIDPVDYADNITALSLFIKKGTLEKIDVNHADYISRSSKENMMKLFMEIEKWDREKKITAGALQYSDLSSYAKTAGIRYKHNLTERCMKEYLPKMMKSNAHDFMLKFSSKENLFSPIS